MKKHSCKIPGCGKAFSRPSHLQRHALNHTNTQWVCQRCNACFKRLDLLERHKTRHESRDKSAGGVGLGVLETKSKHFKHNVDARSSQERHSHDLSPSPSTSEPTQRPHNDSISSIFPVSRPPESWNSAQELPGSSLGVNYFDAQVDFEESPRQASDYGFMNQSPGIYEIGNMYHDMTFDQVHFNVTGFAPPQPDCRHVVPQPADDPSINTSEEAPNVDLEVAPEPNASLQNEHMETYPTPTATVPTPVSCEPVNDVTLLGEVMEDTEESTAETQAAVRRSSNDSSAMTLLALSRAQETLPMETSSAPKEAFDISTEWRRPSLKITGEKREQLLEFITEIRPVRPDGTLLDGKSRDFRLENLQQYLDLFLEYFNTSYPLIHVATLDISDMDPIALLCVILQGATYKDKHSHQFSVCLYDAIVPYILSGLLGSPVPDLSILQAFLILECYGMYRAGPYQRENAILIHGLLLNSIRRISRYHVRARITLPDRLTHKERDWMEFAYAEQYKRLILFFFIWDTQNATCYSFMPNMSIQSLHIGIPCSKKLWEAATEAEWKLLLTTHDESATLLSIVKKFVNNDEEMLCRPYDELSFNLTLHGLMSMCNDMLHFDNRSVYLGDLEAEEDTSWSPWRQQIAQSLESWKAKYDAFAMETIWEMQRDLQQEPLHCIFQRDSMAHFALYHTAHIVLNCEIRHLQTAAGAKAIFGHIVTPSDYEESCRYIRQWILRSPDSAGRAAWHAAQMFREGMLNLLFWDVHGVFHYPWCLYIGALTCWAFHHFGSENMRPLCNHEGDGGKSELRTTSRLKMNHLVSTMASVTPANMERVMGKCCTHGLTREMAKYLRGVRWTAAYEAMKILEGLSGIAGD